MLLTRLKRSFSQQDYFLDEVRLTEQNENCEDWLYCGYIDTTEIFISNMYRKTLCILLCLLYKKGLCKIDYKLTDLVGGFDMRNATKICAQDKNYQSAYIALFKQYGWDFPNGWNTLCDGKSYIPIVEDDEIIRSYEEKGNAEFAGELTSGLLTLTLHCNKFDEVYRIYKKTAKNSMVAEEYHKIWNMMQEISFSAIVDFAEYEDTFFKKGKAYFVSCIDRSMEGGWGYHVKDLRTMLRPHLFFNIPILDRMMDRFIKKWEV